jgi:biotin transport system substrate-specific component
MKKISTGDLCRIALFTALIAAGAFIKIPTPLVPITLQLGFVVLAGMLLGPVNGTLSVVLYILIGRSRVYLYAHLRVYYRFPSRSMDQREAVADPPG